MIDSLLYHSIAAVSEFNNGRTVQDQLVTASRLAAALAANDTQDQSPVTSTARLPVQQNDGSLARVEVGEQGSANPNRNINPRESINRVTSAAFSITYDVGNNDTERFFFTLMPAVSLNNRISGAGGVPEVKRGICLKTMMNHKKFNIPGSSPIYQNLGISQQVLMLVGTFVGNERSLTTAFADSNTPTRTSVPVNTSQILRRVLNREGGIPAPQDAYSNNPNGLNAYRTARTFNDDVVLRGTEAELHLIAYTSVQADEQLDIVFTGFISSMRYMFVRSDRTYYAMDFVITRHGEFTQAREPRETVPSPSVSPTAANTPAVERPAASEEQSVSRQQLEEIAESADDLIDLIDEQLNSRARSDNLAPFLTQNASAEEIQAIKINYASNPRLNSLRQVTLLNLALGSNSSGGPSYGEVNAQFFLDVQQYSPETRGLLFNGMREALRNRSDEARKLLADDNAFLRRVSVDSPNYINADIKRIQDRILREEADNQDIQQVSQRLGVPTASSITEYKDKNSNGIGSLGTLVNSFAFAQDQGLESVNTFNAEEDLQLTAGFGLSAPVGLAISSLTPEVNVGAQPRTIPSPQDVLRSELDESYIANNLAFFEDGRVQNLVSGAIAVPGEGVQLSNGETVEISYNSNPVTEANYLSPLARLNNSEVL